MTSFDNLSFITNNVKRIKSIKKRLKLIEYFKSIITTNGILFLQETHSSSDDEQKWRDNFGGNTFFSHRKRNSWKIFVWPYLIFFLSNTLWLLGRTSYQYSFLVLHGNFRLIRAVHFPCFLMYLQCFLMVGKAGASN